MEQRAGRYEFISQIAAGPLGALWAAHVTEGAETGRVVAVRRIPTAAIDNAAERELVEAAFAAMEIRHPKLAAVLDVVVTPAEVAVVSEYVEGELLRSIQRRAGLMNRPLPIRIGLRIALDALQGLEGAIAAWPGNRAADRRSPPLFGGMGSDQLLVASFGETIQLDVGVAASAMRQRVLAHHPDICVYRAPEQLEENPSEDERTDVFTTGILIWELLANRPLFGPPKWTRFSSKGKPLTTAADSQLSHNLRKRVRDAKIARLDALVRAGERVPTAIATIVAKSLERDPDRRYPSVASMIAALEELGPRAVASHEDVSRALRDIAATSLEARRAALAAFSGQLQAEKREVDSTIPTKPPQRIERPSSPALDASELGSWPKPPAIPTLGVNDERENDRERGAKKKPPLPTKRRRGTTD